MGILTVIAGDLERGWGLIEGKAEAALEAIAEDIWGVLKAVVVPGTATQVKALIDALRAAWADAANGGNAGQVITAGLNALSATEHSYWVSTLDPALLQVYADITQLANSGAVPAAGGAGSTGATGATGA
jgi:hypothetical protein